MKELNAQNNKLAGTLLLGAGILFLITQIFNISLMGLLWPFFIILPGLPFLYAAWTGGKKLSALIFPGLIISGTGLILLYQSLTGHWESWAYAWTLYPALVGLGLRFHGERNGSEGEANTGKGMIRYSLMAFVGLMLLFELLIFGSIFSGFTGVLLTLALIAGGVYLLNRNKADEDDAPVKIKHTLTTDFDTPKRKNTVSVGSVNGSGRSSSRPYEDGPSPEISPELRRKIEEALAEDDDKEDTR